MFWLAPLPQQAAIFLKVYTREPCVSSRRGRRGSSPPDGSQTSTGQSKPLPANCPKQSPPLPTGRPLDTNGGCDWHHTKTLTSVGSGGQTRRPVTTQWRKWVPTEYQTIERRESVALPGWNKTAEQNLVPLVGRGVMWHAGNISVGVREMKLVYKYFAFSGKFVFFCL